MKMTTILLLCSIMVLNHCNAFSPSLTSRVESKLQSVHQQSQLEEAGDHGHHSASRRDLLTFGFVVAPMLFRADEASAFSNKISDKYDDRPKRRGPQVSGCNFSTDDSHETAPRSREGFLTLSQSC